ncbi:MAG: serine/threonine protein kinase [Blastocatellia bacterium]
MSPERWKKLEEICHAAWTLKQSERRAFLDQASGGDEELRRKAEELLAADATAREGFLQSGAFSLGMQVLAGEETRRTDMNPARQKLDDRYEIIRELGEGGMGKVYQARDTRVSDRLVVVKVLQEKWLQHEWVVTKFKQEAAVLARIDDPGVVGILDAGVLPDGQPWLVEQFVEGADLSHHVKEAGSGMDFAEAAEIIKQIGRALTAAHETGVIHRDLKPANIMIRRKTNGELQVKVIDFGIAKIKNSAAGSTPATKFRVGTPLYMPPEQRNMQEVTPASDVYAMGMMAYEMLTGPFDQKEIPELIKNGVKEKPSARRPGLPEAVDRVIFKALSLNANERQQSARKFGDDLTLALAPSRRKLDWRVVAVAAVILVAVLTGLLWWILSDHPLPPEEVVGVRPAGQLANGTTVAPANPRIYDAEASFPTRRPPKGMTYATIGFTVWRTRPATARDGEDVARETIDSQEVASERIADSISDGERIYLGIESLTGTFLPDKGGYLYVINREQYANGTFGRARLIFPTLLTYGGQNRVKPGQPIVLPETNRPFIIKRSSPAHVAETYTIILSPWQFQLPEPLGNTAMVLPDNLVADWEKQYGGRMYRATLRGGEGKTRTKRELAVGSRATVDTAEPLTLDELLPQNCYRGTVKNGDPAMVTIILRFRD